MARILSINGYGDEKENSLFDSLKYWFSSQDKFIKISVLVLAILFITTPFIIAEYLQTKQYASSNELITFLNLTDETPLTQTDTPEIRLRLTPPKDWTLAQKSMVSRAHAQDASPTDIPASQEATPTLTITPTQIESSPTEIPSPSLPLEISATPSALPIDTPIASISSVLTSISIFNSDDGEKNGHEPLTIQKKDIITALSNPIPWKLNSLTGEEISATRTVTVEFIDDNDNKLTAIASIILTRPLIPTPQATEQLTPTVTPSTSPTPEITTILTPSATSSPTPTISRSAGSNEPRSVPGELIVRYKNDQTPQDILQKVVERQVQKQSFSGRTQIAITDAATNIIGGDTPEEILQETIATNEKVDVVKETKAISDPSLSKEDTPLNNFYIIKADKDIPISELEEEYKKLSNVQYVEPNYIIEFFDDEPPNDPPPPPPTNDPFYSNQWYLPLINISEAWQQTTGSEDIKVAIIDTGVKVDHPDLPTERITVLPTLYCSGTCPPQHYHGTFIAGIIAGRTNNSLGISGMDWHANILSYKVADGNVGSWTAAFDAIYRAVQAGAKVINVSWGYQTPTIPGCAPDSGPQEIVSYARNHGVTVVTAAGNNAVGVNAGYWVPGSCNGVINVGSSTAQGSIAPYSANGPYVDLYAPAGANDSLNNPYWGIWSTDLNGSYKQAAGTSFSAPQVTAAAALILAVNPNLTPNQIEDILKRSFILNVPNALLAATSGNLPPTATPLPQWTPTPTSIPTPNPSIPAQRPVKNNLQVTSGVTPGDISISSMGFRFKPLVNGNLTNVWTYAHYNFPLSSPSHIKLYTDNGTLLKSAEMNTTLSGTTGWKGTFFPYFLTADTYYKLVLVSTGHRWYILPIEPVFPRTFDSIVIDSDLQVVAGNTLPGVDTINGNKFLHGLVDIQFVPVAAPTSTPTPTATQTPTPTPTATPIPAPVNRFAIAGCGGGPIAGIYCYNWYTGDWPVSALSYKDKYAWMIGKLDRNDGLRCISDWDNPPENRCTEAKIDAIFNIERPKIEDMLDLQINKGGVWIVGNEANLGGPEIPASLYAYQYKKYHDLIKGLDQTAKIAHSGLLYHPNGYSLTNPKNPVTYLTTFLQNPVLGGIKPDIYNVHFYPGNTINESSFMDSKNKAVEFSNYVTSIDPTKPIWVTEFGIHPYWATADSPTATLVNRYMDVMISYFLTNHRYARWFWFVSNSGNEDYWKPTSLLTPDGNNLTAVGTHYLELMIANGETPPPTPTPTNTPTSTPTQTPTPTPTATPIPIPGDVDKNGCVGTVDFTIWYQVFRNPQDASPSDRQNSDLNHDNTLNILDFNVWYKAIQSGQNICD